MKDRIRKETIQEKIGMISVIDKMSDVTLNGLDMKNWHFLVNIGMLKWIYAHIRGDKIRKETIWDNVEWVALQWTKWVRWH